MLVYQRVSGFSGAPYLGDLGYAAAMQERLAVLDEVKLRKMRRALDIADEQLELKRDRVSDALKALSGQRTAGQPYHGRPWFR